MHKAEIRIAAETALRAGLPDVEKAMWGAFTAGYITEADAEELSNLIALRKAIAQDPQSTPTAGDALSLGATPTARRHGSRPRTSESMSRRRRWAASGRLPPRLASRFTLAEQAVLSIVAAEVVKRGDCRLPVGQIAATAGVSETTVRKAIREARNFGLVTVEERRLSGFRNLSNVVRIVLEEWTSWLRLTRRASPVSAPEGGRVHFSEAHAYGRSRTWAGKANRRPIAGPESSSGEMSRVANASGRPFAS